MRPSYEQDAPLAALEQYMRHVHRIPRLEEEEEKQLLQRMKSGGVGCSQNHLSREVGEARDRLIEGYQPFVIGLAKRYVRHCREMDLMDLIQEGNSGLLRALEKYDLSKCVSSSFRTWAFSWIRGTMLIAFWQCEGAIRLPLQKVQAIRQMGVVNTQLLCSLGHEPTIEETAREMQVSERDVRELIVLQEQQVVSLHAFPNEDEDCSLEEVIEDPAASAFAVSSLQTPLETALESLTERERVIVKLRYGFDDGYSRTKREVAHVLGVAVSTVDMLDRRARTRLRRVLEKRAS